MIQDDLTSLFAYLRWADGRMFETLRRLSEGQYTREPAPGWSSVRATVVHMGDAATIWARRLDGVMPTTRRSWADVPTLADAEALFREGHDAFDRLLAATTPERLAAAWTYLKLDGQPATLPVWAVFRHVANHATYHRGQVASKLRLLGAEPPATDLMLWAFEATAS